MFGRGNGSIGSGNDSTTVLCFLGHFCFYVAEAWDVIIIAIILLIDGLGSLRNVVKLRNMDIILTLTVTNLVLIVRLRGGVVVRHICRVI